MGLVTALLVTVQDPAPAADPVSEATAHWQAGRLEQALDLLESSLRTDPDSVPLWSLQGSVLRSQAEQLIATGGKGFAIQATYMDSAASFRLASELASPPQADLYVGWSDAAHRGGEPERALAACDQGLASLPGDASIHYQRGRVREGQSAAASDRSEADGLRALAIADYRAVTDTGQWLGAAYSRMAVLHGAGARPKEARAAWLEALSRDPLGADHRTLSATDQPATLRILYDEALAGIQRGVANPPTGMGHLYWWAGWHTWAAQDPAAARDRFRQALKTDPTLLNAAYYVAKTSTEMSDGTGAIEGWTTFARADMDGLLSTVRTGGEAEIQNTIKGMVWCIDLAVRGDDLKAAALLARIQALLEPENADAWNNLGLFLRDSNQDEESLKAYERALILTPDDPDVLNATAVVLQYNLQRDYLRARTLYEKAILHAERVLADDKASAAERAQAETARFDANNNLAKLAIREKREKRKREREERKKRERGVDGQD